MNRFKRITAVMLALMIMLTIIPALETTALAESDGMVRVKITRLGSPTAITFTTGCDYFVDGDKAVRIPSGSKVNVSVSGTKLTLNCGSYSLNMGSDFTINRMYAGTTGVKFTTPALGNVYCGDFRFMLEGGKITTIMTTYVEDYLYGVVGYEMSNSYPLEALKVQAVAARNYVLRAKQTRSSRAYDVVDTSSDQVFRGYNSSHTRAIKAVDETRGMVLGYGGKLASCYYGSSNGGQTQSTKNIWGSSLAYSVVKEDRFDLEGMGKCNTVTLKKDLSGTKLNSKLHAALVSGMKANLEKYDLSTDAADVRIESIVDIVPCNPKYGESSILFKTLKFTVVASSVNAAGERVSGTVTVDVPTYGGIEDWYDLSINSSDNETIAVTETETGFTIAFRRWGHGVGMSQHGARIMAMNYSMDYIAILDFYYPGTELSHVNLYDATGKNLTESGDSSDLEIPITPANTPAPDSNAKPVMQANVKLSSASSTLNMRSGASTSTSVVTRLKHGVQVDVYAIEGEWVAIGYDGYRGYVMKKYLVAASAGSTAPTPAPVVTPAPEAGEQPIMQAKVQLSSTTSTLNVRKGASTSTAVVVRLKHGAQVDVYAIEGSWVAIGYNGYRGYVMKKYLAAVPAATQTPTAAPTAEPTTEPTAEPTKAPETAEKPIMQAKVKLSSATGTLNVRKGASTSTAIVTRLKHGTTVDVYAIEGKWVAIGYNGYRGYVMKSYLVAVSGDNSAAQPDSGNNAVYAKVVLSASSSKLKLRQGPGTSYGVITLLSHGQYVKVTAITGSWARVETTGGKTGYVHKNYLRQVSAEEATGSIIAVAVESTFVYSGLDTSSAAIAGLDVGDTVTVTAYNSTWARVLIDGKTGYVPTEHLKRAD